MTKLDGSKIARIEGYRKIFGTEQSVTTKGEGIQKKSCFMCLVTALSLKCSYLRRLPSRLTRVITAHVAFVSNAFFGSCFFFPRTKKHFTPVFANFSLSNKEHFGLDYEIDNFG